MWENRGNAGPEGEEGVKLFCSNLRIVNIETKKMIPLLRKYLLFLQRTHVWFPAPLSGSSKLFITRVHIHLYIRTHIHLIKIKTSLKKAL